MKKACVFDLDGTLANTLESIAYFANMALRHAKLPEIDTERYRYLVGDGAKVLVERMLTEVGAFTESTFEAVSNDYNQSYDNNFLYLTKVYDGIVSMLEGLKDRGCRLAVLSNKPHVTTTKIVRELFDKKMFDLCYGQRAGVPKKPDPTALLNILKELQIEPQSCAYFGDTGTDMQTGKNAGIYTIGVLWGFREREELLNHGADALIAAPDEAIDCLENIRFWKRTGKE